MALTLESYLERIKNDEGFEEYWNNGGRVCLLESPIKIEFDNTLNTIFINGLPFSFDVFEYLAAPDHQIAKFAKEGELVTIRTFPTLRNFFEQVKIESASDYLVERADYYLGIINDNG